MAASVTHPQASVAALAFLPLTRPTIDEETIAGVVQVLRSGWITSGPQVKEFEAKLSAYFGGRPVRAFNSGTCTMEIALRILGIGPGDEVITTPLTWVATSNVILEVGARPVFVDIDPQTRNIDLNKIEAAITSKTRAIIPVDLAGLPVDRDRLYEIANRRKIRVIEDAAQSFGSSFKGKKIGSFGDFVSFSFHPNKNITSIEGGCLVFNTEAEAKLAEQYRLQGVIRTGNDGMDVERVGGKFNLTDVAARVGIGQLPKIDEFNVKRAELVKYYFELFSQQEAKKLGLGLPLANFTDTNWHMFQVMLPGTHMSIKRSDVMGKLTEVGIGSGVHYPVIHLFSLYRSLGWKEGDFPVAENAGRNLLTLPLFPSMTRADVERVVKALVAIVSAHI
ncbi:MAG: DegT/DnrJ/EryC1/StrS aminotransferase family protein [Verrucomicrobiota bacterium]|jgi:dTDP-4-amino-4,6-dideoxygalactose transaminase|nr:MAG: DegT/DnrJ/EryC1/StrS aminotransferase family protein [Verrucomicrobiota bacterium]